MSGIFAILLAIVVGGCAELRYVVKHAQDLVEHPIAVTAIAASQDTRCDEQPTTLAEAQAKLTVPIVETRITRGMQMALPRRMLAQVGFSKLPDATKLRKIRHELVHYCQRLLIACFDQLWLYGSCDEPEQLPRSDFRWAFEVAAYRVSSGVMPGDFGWRYLAEDLEPGSYAEHTAAALSVASDPT